MTSAHHERSFNGGSGDSRAELCAKCNRSRVALSCSNEAIPPLWCSPQPEPAESRRDGNVGWHGRGQIQRLCVVLAWNLLAVVCTDLFLWLYIPTVRFSPHLFSATVLIPADSRRESWAMWKRAPALCFTCLYSRTHFCCELVVLSSFWDFYQHTVCLYFQSLLHTIHCHLQDYM